MIGRKTTVTPSMIIKVSWLDDASQTVRLTSGAIEEGSLFLVKKEGAEENLAGQFQIALETLHDLKDVTLFGTVVQNPSLTNQLPVLHWFTPTTIASTTFQRASATRAARGAISSISSERDFNRF